MPDTLLIRQLGRREYESVWHAMQNYTDSRDSNSADEIWLVEHEPVFTQGQAGKEEHLLLPGDIPVVKVDRGGQVTYHGPGQLVAYFLLDIRRLKMGVRDLVTEIEQSLVELLKGYDIDAYAKADAPGVYVDEKKVASLGLRIRKGCSFHGLALNVNMDLDPFLRINPCGYAGLEMVQVSDLGGPSDMATIQDDLTRIIAQRLNYQQIETITGFMND
ncbi:lipoyl(octanoyl) transferase LipB [Psychrobium sp. 1_MG-2023]|uniref:lipoyl(octanoyl) transferase LipB n=1 Tax=Psychrobium sp. 1_MG-2023 TaxID=3062624 RepID=UPI00351EB3CB